MKKVFIDGSAGTTGLRIRERLVSRHDVELITLLEEERKNPAARRDALNASDIAFLCLPDLAAIEAVEMIENKSTVVIDTSTAHRTNPDWTYGFAEINNLRESLANSKRIANPGCHASGFIALVAPLVNAGILDKNSKLCAFSLTGFSGGGKKMIASYDSALNENNIQFFGARQYALNQSHKHLPEMTRVCGLASAPVFSPIVVPHFSGMQVTVQLHDVSLEEIKKCYQETYARKGLVSFVDDVAEDGFISSANYYGKDTLSVSAYGNDERVILVSCFDNLGKGASGAAIQNMNIALGRDEFLGLVQ